MESPVISETEQIYLQALALHQIAVGDIANNYTGKIGLSRNRAERRKLRTVEFNHIVAVGRLVLERLQILRRILGRIIGLASEQRKFMFHNYKSLTLRILYDMLLS